jgi:hypothetical protein
MFCFDWIDCFIPKSFCLSLVNKINRLFNFYATSFLVDDY